MNLTVFHCSDLHFGRWAIPEQYEALQTLIQNQPHDVVAISGDVSQRARIGEFQRAREFIRHASEVSHTIVVPGNHDIAWWRAPFGVGDTSGLFDGYRRYVSDDLEPVLRVSGATFVGLNTAHGIVRATLTWNYRDLSILGHLSRSQIDRARAAFSCSPATDVRIIVVHHNVVKGELSQRFGLKRCDRILDAFAGMGVDLVLCGHDHQEAAQDVQCASRGVVVSTASATSGHMVRGGRPPAAHSIRISPSEIEVTMLIWSADGGAFRTGPISRFARGHNPGGAED